MKKNGYFAALAFVVITRDSFVSSNCVCNTLQTGRRLDSSNVPHVSFEAAEVRGMDYKRPSGLSKVPLSEYTPPSATLNYQNPCDSNQVHITMGNSVGSVIVSFASYNNTASSVYFAQTESALLSSSSSNTMTTGSSFSYSELISVGLELMNSTMGQGMASRAAVLNLEDSANWAFDTATGQHWANWFNITKPVFGLGNYNNPTMYYDSPLLHTVEVAGLVPGNSYYYRVSGSCVAYKFTLPPQSSPSSKFPYPFSLGLTGDLGQTNVTTLSINSLISMNPAAVLLAGDLAYADGWPALWDRFGNIIEPLASRFLLLTAGGNHEGSYSENWLSYLARYPTPHTGSGSSSFCYWAKEVGPVHLVTLCSYAGYTNTSLQYRWLQKHLATALDRTATPWLVVMMHVPWYNSNFGHWKEGELMRQTMEPLMFQYGVDLVLDGHQHSYERTYPVYNNALNPCGTVYLNLGDGGNYDGPTPLWMFYNLTVNGVLEKHVPPVWSAFREASFGVGELIFLNGSQGNFSWHRHGCGSNTKGALGMNFSNNCVTPYDGSAQRMLTSDSFFLIRPSANVCPNKHVSTFQQQAPTSPPSSSSSSSPTPLSTATIALITLSCVLFTVCIVLSYLLWQAHTTYERNKRTNFPDKPLVMNDGF